MSVVSAGTGKGLGVFAAEHAHVQRWVGSYHGERLSIREFSHRYRRGNDPVYGFRLSQSIIIDGRNSTHFSRYINHDEHGNLKVDAMPRSRVFCCWLLSLVYPARRLQSQRARGESTFTHKVTFRWGRNFHLTMGWATGRGGQYNLVPVQIHEPWSTGGITGSHLKRHTDCRRHFLPARR